VPFKVAGAAVDVIVPDEDDDNWAVGISFELSFEFST
jgi:hypothetical protein